MSLRTKEAARSFNGVINFFVVKDVVFDTKGINHLMVLFLHSIDEEYYLPKKKYKGMYTHEVKNSLKVQIHFKEFVEWYEKDEEKYSDILRNFYLAQTNRKHRFLKKIEYMLDYNLTLKEWCFQLREAVKAHSKELSHLRSSDQRIIKDVMTSPNDELVAEWQDLLIWG